MRGPPRQCLIANDPASIKLFLKTNSAKGLGTFRGSFILIELLGNGVSNLVLVIDNPMCDELEQHHKHRITIRYSLTRTYEQEGLRLQPDEC